MSVNGGDCRAVGLVRRTVGGYKFFPRLPRLHENKEENSSTNCRFRKNPFALNATELSLSEGEGRCPRRETAAQTPHQVTEGQIFLLPVQELEDMQVRDAQVLILVLTWCRVASGFNPFLPGGFGVDQGPAVSLGLEVVFQGRENLQCDCNCVWGRWNCWARQNPRGRKGTPLH